jgi:hypothetical protein
VDKKEFAASAISPHLHCLPKSNKRSHPPKTQRDLLSSYGYRTMKHTMSSPRSAETHPRKRRSKIGRRSENGGAQARNFYLIKLVMARFTTLPNSNHKTGCPILRFSEGWEVSHKLLSRKIGHSVIDHPPNSKPQNRVPHPWFLRRGRFCTSSYLVKSVMARSTILPNSKHKNGCPILRFSEGWEVL